MAIDRITSCTPKRLPSSPERLRSESLVAQEFVTGFQNKADQLRIQHGTSRLALSDSERQLLKRAIYENAGFIQGFSAGLFTLIMLRRGPILLGRYIQKRWGPKKSTASSSSTGTSGTRHSHVTTTTNSPFQQQRQPQATVVPPNESPLMKAGWWMIDFTLSSAVACMAASLTANQEGMLFTVSQVPRLSESQIAESFCPEAISILKELKEREAGSAAALLESPESVILQAMIDFTKACQQRENRKEFLAKRESEVDFNPFDDDGGGDESFDSEGFH